MTATNYISNESPSSEKGFSLVELLMVLLVISVLGAVSVPYYFSYQKLYQTEDQALKMIDMMQEASQRALTRRRTVRFEIDLTENAMHIIDENGADPHVLVRTVGLLATNLVRLDTAPSGVSVPNPPNYPMATFEIDNVGHERGGVPQTGNTVWVARFRSDGSVINNANVPLNVSLILWPPKAATPGQANSPGEIRALTLFAGSGALKYWRYDGANFNSY